MGLGGPLLRESWLYRPFSAGWFMGGMWGSPLVDDWVEQRAGFLGGYRFGWDTSYFWGAETRFSFGVADLYDSQRAIAARPDHGGHRTAELFYWDIDLLYYPWGDAQWRPYFLFGLGAGHIGFSDRTYNYYGQSVFQVPLAVGLKYRCNDWLALRLELADNFLFCGDGVNVVDNLSLTAGMEIRFGGTRKAYWPWNPGRHYW